MKITRKVGRRKHSRHSSISRRRLRNNKNKKSYGKTHKGGCWSGSKTKKGGARSRKYGHKRGKRFHRGGVGCENVNFQNFTEESSTSGSGIIYKSKSKNNIILTYRKENSPFSTSSEFSVEVKISKTDTNNVTKTIYLKRISDMPSIELFFDDTILFSLLNKINKQSSNIPITLRAFLSNSELRSSKLSYYASYYFDYKENLKCFQQIYNFVNKLTYPPIYTNNPTDATSSTSTSSTSTSSDISSLKPPPTIIAEQYTNPDDGDDENPQMAPRLPITASE
jgi:hypothetical protein